MAWSASPIAHLVAQSVAGGTFTSASINTTGGDTLFAVVGDLSGTGVVSDSKTNTWVQLTGASKVGSSPTGSIWYAKAATCGTGHTFTLTGASTFATICVSAFSGGDLTAPFDTTKENGASASAATIQPGSITPSVANCLIICGEASDNGSGTPTYSISAGFTVTDYGVIVGGAAYGAGMAYSVQTTATATNPTWTYTSPVTGFRANIAAFKAGAATTKAPLPTRRPYRFFRRAA